MATIMMPTQEAPTVRKGKKSGAGLGQQIGAIAGGIAGASGGPMGAVQGAAAGASAGGMLGGMIQPGTPGTVVQPQRGPQGIQTASTGAVDRRLQEIQQNPQFQLQQAKVALAELPTDVQKQYAPTIESTLDASRRAQKVGMA